MNRRFLIPGIIALSLLLSGCKVTLYSGLSEYEANQMLALLIANRIDADKQTDEAGALTLRVEKSLFIRAVEVLRQNGYPRPKYASVTDVFPLNQLISSPEQERVKMNYLKEQKIESMLMSIDGVIVARVSIGHAPLDSLGMDTAKPTVSVLIKHSPATNLAVWQEQIRDLVRQGVPGISDDRISVLIVPAAYRYRPLPAQAADLSWWRRLAQKPVLSGSMAALLLALIVLAISLSRWQSRRAT